MVVLSESRDDFTSEMDLALFRQLTFDGLIASKRVLEIDGPTPRTVAGFDALQTGALVVLKDRWLIKYHPYCDCGRSRISSSDRMVDSVGVRSGRL